MMNYRNGRSYCRPFTTVTKRTHQNVTTQYRHVHELRNRSSPAIRGTIPPRNFGQEPPTLAINQFAEMTRCYTNEDVANFTSLIGDENPIHQCSAAATTTTYNIVVPGLLVGSIFSAVIGTLLPGSIYVRQTYDFRHAVSVGEWITGRIVIAKLRTVARPNSPSGIYMVCHTLAYQSPFLEDSNKLNGERPNHNVTEEAATAANAPPEIPPTQRILIRGEASVWIPNV